MQRSSTRNPPRSKCKAALSDAHMFALKLQRSYETNVAFERLEFHCIVRRLHDESVTPSQYSLPQPSRSTAPDSPPRSHIQDRQRRHAEDSHCNPVSVTHVPSYHTVACVVASSCRRGHRQVGMHVRAVKLKLQRSLNRKKMRVVTGIIICGKQRPQVICVLVVVYTPAPGQVSPG